jgi:hypothetical protein
MSESPKDQDIAKGMALTFLAAARAEVTTREGVSRDEIREFRQTWADMLATFLGA